MKQKKFGTRKITTCGRVQEMLIFICSAAFPLVKCTMRNVFHFKKDLLVSGSFFSCTYPFHWSFTVRKVCKTEMPCTVYSFSPFSIYLWCKTSS